MFFFLSFLISWPLVCCVTRESFPCVSAPPRAFALLTPLDQVDVVDSAFEGNYVSDVASWRSNNYYAGGGLAVYGEAEIALRTASFVGNGAEVGGGVSVRGNCTVAVHGSLFDGNLAFSRGGGFSGGVSVCVCVSVKKRVCGRSIIYFASCPLDVFFLSSNSDCY